MCGLVLIDRTGCGSVNHVPREVNRTMDEHVTADLHEKAGPTCATTADNEDVTRGARLCHQWDARRTPTGMQRRRTGRPQQTILNGQWHEGDPATACREKQTGGKEELTGSRCCEGRYDSSLHSLGLRTMGSFTQDDCECHFASLQCGGASTDR